MSGPKLRAGVVGLGWAGRQHMAAYAGSPDVELVGIAGMEVEALQELGDQYGIATDQRHRDWKAQEDPITVLPPRPSGPERPAAPGTMVTPPAVADPWEPGPPR